MRAGRCGASLAPRNCLHSTGPLLFADVSEAPWYLPIGDEVAVFTAAYECRLPELLKGPTGCGKTRFIEFMAHAIRGPARDGLPDNLITVACHEDLTGSDLVGRYLIKG